MTIRLIALVLLSTIINAHAGKIEETSDHLTFSLVRGSIGFVSQLPGGMMTVAPYTVLAFAAKNQRKYLVIADSAGDYTAVLEPGEYCVSAYGVKTGDVIPFDSRQLKCINVLLGKDARLDVMLVNTR